MITLAELAERLGATFIGDGTLALSDICTPEKQKDGAVCILSDQKKAGYLSGSAAAYVVPADFKADTSKPLIVVKNTRVALVTLLNILRPVADISYEISTLAAVSVKARLATDTFVGDFAVIKAGASIGRKSVIHNNVSIGEDVILGEECVIHPNVSIYPGCTLGDRVIIHSGTVIGSDGFGYIPGASHTKIPQRGAVIIHSDVELGANCTVDRGVIDDTVIGQGCKLDNMVHIAHNVVLGRGVLLAGQVAVSGSSELGDYVIAGGQVGIADHVTIASGVQLAAQSGIAKSITESGAYGGTPTSPAREWAKQVACVNALPDMRKRLTELERKIK